MYMLRGIAPDFKFQKKSNSRQEVTIWSGMDSNDILLGPYFFVCNVNNNSYLEILDNFILAQLQDFFNTQFESGCFQRLW